MRNYLLDAPSWLSGLIAGLLYGVLFGLAVRVVADESWTSALVAGAVTAPAFGILMGLVSRRTKRLLAPVDGDGLDRNQRGVALRAAQRGQVPSDPAVRAAAVVFARRQLAQSEARWVRVTLVVGSVFLVLSAVLNLLDGDGRWWGAVLPLCGVAVFVFVLAQPRRLRRRIAALSADQADETSD